MRDPKKRAISAACHWLNKCYDLGITAAEIVAQSTVNREAVNHAVNRKESGEREKETSPHTPYKEERERGEKAAAAAAARACAYARAEGIPTFEQVEKFAAVIGASPAFAKSWFDQMERVYQWRHPKDGKRINNWQRNLQLWWKRRDEFDPLPPPEEDKPKETFEEMKKRILEKI